MLKECAAQSWRWLYTSKGAVLLDVEGHLQGRADQHRLGLAQTPVQCNPSSTFTVFVSPLLQATTALQNKHVQKNVMQCSTSPEPAVYEVLTGLGTCTGTGTGTGTCTTCTGLEAMTVWGCCCTTYWGWEATTYCGCCCTTYWGWEATYTGWEATYWGCGWIGTCRQIEGNMRLLP